MGFTAEVNRCRLQRQAGDGGSEFELVTMTLTTMAAVAAPVHVAPERPGGRSAILPARRKTTAAVPLPGAMTLGFEAQQLEHPTNVTSARRRSKSMPGTVVPPVAFIGPWDDTRRRIVPFPLSL